ncbi:unnamed protein product, partial [Rotaria sp. Silwood2]
FDINNSLYDQLLEKVSVQMDRATKWFQFVHYTPYPLIKCNDIGTSYTLVKLPDDSSAVTPCVRLRSQCDRSCGATASQFSISCITSDKCSLDQNS